MGKPTLVEALTEIIEPARVFATEPDRIGYSRDMSVHCAVPDAVVLPRTTQEIQALMRLAQRDRVPITPRGAGTSVTGAILPVRGGVVIDLSLMNRIKSVDLENHCTVVETGVICGALNRTLAPSHFFPPDPGSSPVATIGGMISTNASGLRAVKYGTTRDYVMALEVVLPDGELIRAGHAVPKTSMGYDLVHLFTSAEGTLGVITEATLRIRPAPDKVAFCLAGFPTIDAAGTAAARMLAGGIPLSACEIMDRVSLDVVGEKMGQSFSGINGVLIIEVDGHPAAVDDYLVQIQEQCRSHGAVDIQASADPEQRGRIWAVRQGLVSALSRFKPGHRLIPISEDFGIPISRIPEAITRAQAISEKYDITIATFGHVGDGNMHTTLILDPRDKPGWDKVRGLATELNELALELGGTISAEHGIGLARAPFARRDLGEAHGVMKRIKSLFDPHDIMNPGKLGFDDASSDILDHFAFEQLLGKTADPSEAGKPPFGEESLLCVMCGFCRAVCPAFDATKAEGDNARGLIQLASAVGLGLSQPSVEIADQFYLCTGCDACLAKCPCGIDTTKIVNAARRHCVAAGFAPAAAVETAARVQQTGNIFGNTKAQLPALKAAQELVTAKPGKPRATLFLGCHGAAELDGPTSIVLKLLATADVDLTVFGADQPDTKADICCGHPLTYGAPQATLNTLIERNAERFEQAEPDTVITLCSVCYKTLDEMHGERFAERGIELVTAYQYLARTLEHNHNALGAIAPQKVIYHDPCSLGRHTGDYDIPRKLLTAIPGLELLEFADNRENAICCGGGNGVPQGAPNAARQMARRRLTQALDTGADLLATACPVCRQQFTDAQATAPDNRQMEIVDVIELVGRAMGD